MQFRGENNSASIKWRLHVDLSATLRKEFPKLSDAGGIELMFAEPGKKELMLTPNSPAGMR